MILVFKAAVVPIHLIFYTVCVFYNLISIFKFYMNIMERISSFKALGAVGLYPRISALNTGLCHHARVLCSLKYESLFHIFWGKC